MKKLMILTLGLLVSAQSFALDLNKVKCGAEDLEISFKQIESDSEDFGFADEDDSSKLIVTINGKSVEANASTIEISAASTTKIKLNSAVENIASLKISREFAEIFGEFTTVKGIKLGINCIELKK
jgi:hypothetical protein